MAATVHKHVFYFSFFPEILQNRVKIKYYLNPKIDNEVRELPTRLKYPKKQ
jgi:hypothetical protein